MAVDMERRNFFKGYSLALLDVFFDELRESLNNSHIMENHYFDSFENCYPLLSEGGEMLIEEALNRGIQIEGKSKREIARELFRTERHRR